MRYPLAATIGIAATLALGGPAQAEVSVQGDVRISFGDNDQRAIRDYYGKQTGGPDREEPRGGKGKGHGKGKKKLPPGLAKQGKLPPGIRKQIERGAILQPDIVKEAQPLPRELEARLAPLPSSDQIRVTIGADILILDKQTKKVVDVMRDVVQLAHDISK